LGGTFFVLPLFIYLNSKLTLLIMTKMRHVVILLIYLCGCNLFAQITSTNGNFTATTPINMSLQTGATPATRLTILNSNGFVGINTTAPSDWLHVNGNVRANQFNTVNGIFNTTAAATNMSFNINGTNRLTLLATNGNFGIGTAAPADLLHVNGNLRGTQLNLTGGILNTIGATNLSFRTNGTTQMTLNTNGNLGIGTSTPGAKLSFGDLTSDNTHGITWYNSDPLKFGIYRTAGPWNSPDFQQLQVNWNTGIILNPGVDSDKSYVDVQGNGLRISTGSIGIGTINPTQKLDVNGYFRTGISNQDQFLVRAGSGAIGYSEAFLQGQSLGITLYANPQSTSATTSSGAAIGGGEIGIVTNGYYNTPFVLSVPMDIRFKNNGIETMSVTSNGSVGIGTATPNLAYKLDVAGTINATGILVNGQPISGGTIEQLDENVLRLSQTIPSQNIKYILELRRK
jgi:hypothetical protein